MLQKLSVKWRVLIGCFISYMCEALDMLLLAIALPVMIHDLDMSMSQAGLLGTGTLLGAGLSSLLIGWYSDNFGRRKAMIVCIIIFGILTAALGLSQNWIHVLVLRFFAGLGLGGIWGVIAAYISETWPSNQRGRAASFALSSFAVGAMISAYLGAKILPLYGWRVLFLVGLVGVIAGLYIYFFVPESEEWKKQKAQRQDNPNEKSMISMSEIFTPGLLKTTVLCTLVASFAPMAFWGMTLWIPTFLVKERGFSVADMGMFVVFLNAGMFIGFQIFGYIADLIGRKKTLILTLVAEAIIIPFYVWFENSTLLLIFGGLFGMFTIYTGIFGSYFGELYPVRVRSLGAGFCFNIGKGISALAPLILGQIATLYSLQIGLQLCGALFFLAAITLLFLPETHKKEKILAKKEEIAIN